MSISTMYGVSVFFSCCNVWSKCRVVRNRSSLRHTSFFSSNGEWIQEARRIIYWIRLGHSAQSGRSHRRKPAQVKLHHWAGDEFILKGKKLKESGLV